MSRAWPTVLAMPIAAVYAARFRALRMVIPEDRAFELCSEILARKAGVCGVLLRRAYYRLILPRCGERCTFSFGTVLTRTGVSFGRDVALGIGCVVGTVEFGDDIVVGSHVAFPSGRNQHGFERRDVPMSQQPGAYRTIRVGNDCWIGAGAVVTDDVGEGAIVAAGAVVVSPVPPFTIVGGNPARVIGQRP